MTNADDLPEVRSLGNCPAPSEWLKALDSAVGLSPRLAEHLDQCPACQAWLDSQNEVGPLREYREQLQVDASIYFLDPPVQEGDLGSLGGIAIEAQIGSGGMGIVYRGRDDRLNRLVAVKILRHFDEWRSAQRFQREVRAAGQLQHDHLVPIYSTGFARDGRPYLVMPLVEGQSLREQIADQPLDPRQAARIVRDVATGLSAAHETGLVHRDIKPANILIDRRDNRARLTDFGLARSSQDGTLTLDGMVCGTPEYLAPEQISHPDSSDAQSDQYSLGVTLYECLTGFPPFRGCPLDVLEQHRNDEPTLPRRLNRLIPRDLETICLQAMAREPARRYPSVKAFARDLDRFLEGQPIMARPVSRLTHAWLWSRRNPRLAVTLAALVATLIAGTAISTILWQRSEGKAAEARALAKSLSENRSRLLESVRQFQTRILSAESLHWNMDLALQSQLFNDVIRSLDEFADIENSPATAAASPAAAADALSQDYLQVAQSAWETRRIKEVHLAASRAYERLSSLTAQSSHQSSANWLALSRAARLLLCSTRWTSLTPHELGLEKNWSATATAAADQAVRADPENVSARLLQLSIRLESLQGGAKNGGSLDSSTLQELFQAISSLDLPWQQKIPSLLKTGWLLSRTDHGGTTWLDRNDQMIAHLREELRIVRRPMFSSDRYLALNYWHRSWLAQSQGDHELARTHLQAAVDSFAAGIEFEKHNRYLNQERAEAIAALAQLQQSAGMLTEADLNLDQVLKVYLKVLERDPADLAIRVRLLEHFIHYGDLCLKMDEPVWAYRSFATANEDCKLLLTSQPLNPATDWALQLGIWCIQQQLAIGLPESDRPAGRYTTTTEDALLWLEKYWPTLVEPAREILKRPMSLQPPTPPDFDGLGTRPIDPLRFVID